MQNTTPDKDAVILQLCRWHDAGIPVYHLWRQDQRLTRLAIKRFGKWRAALEAAGLESVREQWSRQRVIRELKSRHRNRQVLDSKLKSAAHRYFGGMGQAYAAAGLPARPKPPHHDWTPADAVEAIQKRYRSGASLSATHREDPDLYAAARRLHRGWTEALRAAGCMPEPTTYISASEVIERIAERKEAGLPLSNCDHHDPVLSRSARKHFGCWSRALNAAGIPATIPQCWSRRRVVQAIQTRHRSGEALSRTWREDKPLFRASVSHFGNWENAMRAAGFNPLARERWTKRRVIERLQAYDERVGITNLSATSPRLADAAARLFGGLDAAFEAAGVEPSPRRWTDARVVAAIQNRYVKGQPKHVDGLGDLRLANAARRRFGSWQAAVEAAGLTGKIIVKKPLRRWSREIVIAEIQNWHQSGRALTSISKHNQGLYCAGKTWFGGWRAALSAAGFQSSHRVWSKELIIDEIRERAQNGRSLSSGDAANRNLAAVAYRHFGSWRKAIHAAGVLSYQADRKGA